MITDADARMYLLFALETSHKGLKQATIPFEVTPRNVMFIHYGSSIDDAETKRSLWTLNFVLISEDKAEVESLAKQFGARPDIDLDFPLKDGA